MTTEQAYIKFLLKTNENLNTAKIAVDRARFVTLFNEAQNKLVEYTLEKKNEDDIRYIQKIVVTKSISSSETSKEYQLFVLPENYFDFSSVYGVASKGKCTNRKIYLFEVKDDNINEILSDEFNNASFIAEEAPFSIASDSIKAYKEDFTYDKLYLTYYRYPTQIKLNDELNPESGFHPGTNPEFDDKFTDRILSLAAGEFELNNESQKSQADKQRTISKI